MIDLQQTRNEVKQRSEYILSLTFESVARPKPSKFISIAVGSVCTDWTVLSEPYTAYNDQGKSTKYVNCRCKCGAERAVIVASLKRGRSKRCITCVRAIGNAKALRLRHGETINIGSQHEDWTVISEPYRVADKNGKNANHVDCKCKCGSERRVLLYALKAGKSKRCKDCVDALRRKDAAAKRAKA